MAIAIPSSAWLMFVITESWAQKEILTDLHKSDNAPANCDQTK